MVPNGVGTGKPPAKSFAPRTVWQSLQLPTAASSRPRLTSAGSNDCAAGGSIAAIGDRQLTANAATAPAAMIPAMTPAMTRKDAIGYVIALGSRDRLCSMNAMARRFNKWTSERERKHIAGRARMSRTQIHVDPDEVAAIGDLAEIDHGPV